MKKIFATLLLSLFSLPLFAQYDADTENGVVSLPAAKGFVWESANKKFEFKPYLMVQTAIDFIIMTAKALTLRIIRIMCTTPGSRFLTQCWVFTGRAFGFITYNLSINAAASGGGLLQQAWADMKMSDGFHVRVGKFKTPFTHATLTTLGETLFPTLLCRSQLLSLCPIRLMPSRPL